METIREHWISLDKCPACHSKKTFHSEWMKSKDLQEKSTLNVYQIIMGRTNPNDSAVDHREGMFSKVDLCLKCGHTWVMYVSHVKFDKEDQ